MSAVRLPKSNASNAPTTIRTGEKYGFESVGFIRMTTMEPSQDVPLDAGQAPEGHKRTAAPGQEAQRPAVGHKRTKPAFTAHGATGQRERAYHEPDRQELTGDAFFDSLHLASQDVLSAARRGACPKCGRSRMHFCADCHVLAGLEQGDVPCVDLPMRLDIVKHPQEPNSKSTAIHAKVLAPGQTRIFDFPDFPEFDAATTVLAYPADDAIGVEDLPTEGIQRVVFIDSRWAHCHRMLQVGYHGGQIYRG